MLSFHNMKLTSLQVKANYLLHTSLEYFNVSSAAFNFGVVINVCLKYSMLF